MKWSFIAAALLVAGVSAQQTEWGQCGGQNWGGATTCQSGLTCQYQNPYYSQCLPGGAATPAPPPPPPPPAPTGCLDDLEDFEDFEE